MHSFILRKRIIMILLFFILVWSLYSIFNQSPKQYQADSATMLLYEVSLFQLELLNNRINYTDEFSNDSSVELLKQAVYAVQFTHERLSIAMEYQLPDLKGLDKMMEYIIRLQIGGIQTFNEEAKAVLFEASELIDHMYEHYSHLISSRGQIIKSSKTELINYDEQLYELFQNI